MKNITALPETNKVVVKKSGVLNDQYGVVAKKNITKSDIIFLVKGPIKSKPTKYTLSVNLTTHVDPKREDGSPDFGHYFNHSCNPNTKVIPVEKTNIPYLKVIARRNIKSGEEITFDYASLEYTVTVDNARCLCGEKKCRGVMHGFKDMPEAIIKKYKNEKIIPKYLLDLNRNKPY